jgi:hypothetical protein
VVVATAEERRAHVEGLSLSGALVEARQSSALARVCCNNIAGLSLMEISILLCWFSLVDRAGSWLYCIARIFSIRKVCWVFFPCVEGFLRINYCFILEYMLSLGEVKRWCRWCNIAYGETRMQKDQIAVVNLMLTKLMNISTSTLPLSEGCILTTTNITWKYVCLPSWK